MAQEKWIVEQRQRTLDIQHFHVVFTLPAQLRPLALFTPRLVYSLLFQAASRTLLEFGVTRLHATIGATMVLHTWTRELHFHPHIHAIVTAGGLTFEEDSFVCRGRNFLFPVRAMAQVFRAKMLASLWDAHRAGRFRHFADFDDPERFERLVRQAPKNWHVYAKPAFQRAQHVLSYLGRYTHRVGISTSRLVQIGTDSVTFRTRGADITTVTPVEFLRRLVQHVLPDGFHKIRHVGLNASTTKRAIAARLLRQPPPAPCPAVSWQLHLFSVTGEQPQLCPRCWSRLLAVPSPAARRARAPPPTLQPRSAA